MAASKTADLLPEVNAFLAGGPLPGVVGGQSPPLRQTGKSL